MVHQEHYLIGLALYYYEQKEHQVEGLVGVAVEERSDGWIFYVVG